MITTTKGGPITISYSMLKAYRSCNRKCFLQYVKRVIDSKDVDHRSFIVGICADWLFGKWVGLGYPSHWMEIKAPEIFDWFVTKKRIRYKDGEDKQKLKNKLVRSVQQLEFCAEDIGLSEKKFDLQKQVTFEREGFKFFGKFDMWFPQGNHIWDLKITEATKYLDPFQLKFYAWLIKQVEDKDVGGLAFFSPLMRPYLRSVEWSDEEYHAHDLEVLQLLETLRNETVWERTSKDCWGCAVSRWCELGSEEVIGEQTKVGTIKVSLREVKDDDELKINL